MTKTDSRLLIAVDGGGTGCRVGVGYADRGILAQARGGPANVATDFTGATNYIMATVGEALRSAGLPDKLPDTAVAHLGLAGVNSTEDMAKVEAALPFTHCTVTGDRATAVAGALGPEDGYLVALGTGTIVARQRAGDVKTVGGWGFALSDEASGAWLGRTLLSRIVLAEDGLAAHTPLSRDTLASFGGRDAIVEFSATARPHQYATHAPDIMAAATQGDAIAQEIVTMGAAYIERALAALEFQTGDVLCLSGGLGPHYASFLSAALTENLQPPQGTALEGAFALALKAAAAMDPS